MNQVKYIPLNPVEHENMLRTIIVSHQGVTDGNPTRWVVEAVAEAYQRGFAAGFGAGTTAARTPPAPPPAFRVQIGPPIDAPRPQRLSHIPDDVIDMP